MGHGFHGYIKQAEVRVYQTDPFVFSKRKLFCTKAL